jgi:plastocyanin
MRPALLVAVACLAAATLPSCQTSAIHLECSVVDQGTTVQIVGDAIDGGKFSPAVLCVKAGSRVTWKWRDPYVDHTVSSVPGDSLPFDSGSLSYGSAFAAAFKKPGRYPYVCRLHPSMAGLITVLGS